MKYFSENEVISILINTCKELCKDKIYKPETYMTFREKIDERPSIELPDEHGRLGDLDALVEHIKNVYCKDCKRSKVMCKACEYGDMIDEIEDAPTIVEASNG